MAERIRVSQNKKLTTELIWGYIFLIAIPNWYNYLLIENVFDYIHLIVLDIHYTCLIVLGIVQ